MNRTLPRDGWLPELQDGLNESFGDGDESCDGSDKWLFSTLFDFCGAFVLLVEFMDPYFSFLDADKSLTSWPTLFPLTWFGLADIQLLPTSLLIAPLTPGFRETDDATTRSKEEWTLDTEVWSWSEIDTDFPWSVVVTEPEVWLGEDAAATTAAWGWTFSWWPVSLAAEVLLGTLTMGDWPPESWPDFPLDWFAAPWGATAETLQFKKNDFKEDTYI